jgi:3-deoxy-D-manno-octulosonate 8-phosphate phosphatase (KDO 8-P phosphatase)
MIAPRGVHARARRIRALVFDVDGVLTDGGMILSARGDELKSFHVRDGVAAVLARQAGLRTAFVTGERSPIARIRGRKLGVDRVVLGARRKGEVIEALAAEFELAPAAVAYVGDDLLDLPAFERVGLAIAVADAAAEVRRAAHAVTRAAGGHGVLRECVEFVLGAQGRWRSVVAAYVRQHGGRGSRAR